VRKGSQSDGRSKSRKKKLPKPLDGSPGKHYPYSLQRMFAAIREGWLPGANRWTFDDFLPQFMPHVYRIHERFGGGTRRPTANSVRARLSAFDRGERDIHFRDQKAFADMLGVPTAVLSTFSHLIGDAARKPPRAELVNLLSGIEAAARAMREALPDTDAEGAIINWTGEQAYEVKLDLLRDGVAAFRRADPDYKG